MITMTPLSPTETEAKEIVTKAVEFVVVVEHWIGKNYPSLKA